MPRRLDALIRITIAIAKLNLKSVAEVEDAQEAALFYKDTLRHLSQNGTSSRALAYQQIRQVVKENNGVPMLLTEAATKACGRDQNVRFYLDGKEGGPDNLKLSNNWHLKEVHHCLKKDKSIQFTNEKPIMIRWKVNEDKNQADNE